MLTETWDGLAVSPEPPFGAMVVVLRDGDDGAEVLLLHRRAVTGDDADWAWGPPSGCRFPGEPIAVTAARELSEETGIHADPEPMVPLSADWTPWLVRVGPQTVVTLSDEHDRFAWVSPAEALRRTAPAVVRDQLRAVLRFAGALD